MVQSPYPVAGYPVNYPRVIGGQVAQVAGTRNVVKLGSFLEINGKMEESTTDSLTVKGEFTIQQNGLFDIFSGGDAKFNAYVMSSTDLAGTNVYVNSGPEPLVPLPSPLPLPQLLLPWPWSTPLPPSTGSTSPDTPRTTALAAPPPARPT